MLALVGTVAGPFPRRLRLSLAGGALVAAWLSLGFDAHGSAVLWPYRLFYDYLPGFGGVRVPERLFLWTMLALALLAAAGASAIVRRVPAGRWRGVSARRSWASCCSRALAFTSAARGR